jgi:hypothetical protein
MTEVRDELVKKRYASERRFRFYGASALALTALFLAILLVDIVTRGLPAFTEKTVALDVKVDPAEIDPAQLAGGNYDKLVKDAFRAEFPQVTGRAERKALGALLRTSFEISTSRPDGPAKSLPLHRAVLDAVRDRDPVRAEQAILVLIDGAAQDIELVLGSRRKLPSLAAPAARLKGRGVVPAALAAVRAV